MSDEGGTHADLFAIDLHGFGADERGGDGDRGRNDGVDVLEGRVKFGEQTLSHVKPSQITNGRHFSARIDSLAHFFAVIGGARREISGGFVDMKRFGKRNVGRPLRAIPSSAEGKLPARPRRAFPCRATAASAARRTSASSFSQ